MQNASTLLQDYLDVAIAIAENIGSSPQAAANPPIAQLASVVREDLLRKRASIPPVVGDIETIPWVVKCVDAWFAELDELTTKAKGGQHQFCE